MISNGDVYRCLCIVLWSKGLVREWTDLPSFAGGSDDSWLLSVICSRRTIRTTKEVNIITRKSQRDNVINVLDPLILWGLDVVKKLYATLNFPLASLLGEHMKIPMRSLQDVMSVPIFYNKYLLLTEFEVRSISYNTDRGFSPSIYGPSTKHAGHN